jgi:hypothetical protein
MRKDTAALRLYFAFAPHSSQQPAREGKFAFSAARTHHPLTVRLTPSFDNNRS